MKSLITLAFSIYSLSVFSQTLELSHSSSITISGTSTLHDWTMKSEEHSGAININSKKKTKNTLEEGTILAISIDILVNNLISERGGTMDNKAHRALKMEEFPKITYKLIKAVAFNSFNENNNTLISITGVLNMAGVEKTIVLNNVKATYFNETLSLSGKIPLKLSDFNIDPPSAMFGQIQTGDNITVEFTLEFKK